MPNDDPGMPSWRSALARYLPPDPDRHVGAESGDAPVSAPPPTPLALQFQLRELLVRGTYRWNGPTSRAAGSTKGEGSGEVRLGVRPATRTTRGWASGSLTWSNLPHMRNRLNLDPEQHRWFCEFGALHRASGPAAVSDADWIFLDDAVNAVLWPLLDQASALGIPSVAAGTNAPVHRARRADLSLDVTRIPDGVRATPRLVLDGDLAPRGRAQPIGDHGLHLVDPADSRRIVLAPFAEPLDAEGSALLAAWSDSGSTFVPEQDADEFVHEYLPGLRERIDVTSADASVPLPAAPAPLLVLRATVQGGQEVVLEWHWQRSRRSGSPPALRDVLPVGLLPEEWLPDEEPAAPPLPTTLSAEDAAEFLPAVLPRLRLPCVRVDVVGTLPEYRELTGPPHITLETVPAERPDWFDLGVTVTVDGRTIPFTPLFRALAQGRRRLLLVDGSTLSLAHPAFAPLAELIQEAGDLAEWETGPIVSRHQTSLWADFEDLADEARPAVEWRALLDDVRADSPRPVEPPASIRAVLRPYQAEGLAWLAFLWRHRLGGVLADDMGLGKTLQCLALVQHVRETEPAEASPRPFLVVAPTSVVSNWGAEATRFAPGLVVRTVTATEAKSGTPIAEVADRADVVVTSYALLRLDFDRYQAVAQASGWAGLILDEAQFVKNAASRVHECARDLAVPFRLAVTGTPLENSLTELRALFAIVAPGLFPSARRFAEEYVRPIEQPNPGIPHGVGAGNAPAVAAELRAARLARLRRRIRPFLLRRTKEQVAADLPPKQEQVLRIDLAPEHRALYDVWLQRERRKLFGLLDDMNRNRFIVFRSLTLLRLLALDAALLGDEYAGAPSSKLDALVEQLEDVLAEGHRALVFSQFTSYLALVAARLAAARVPTAYLDGGTRDRDGAIAAFREGQAQVFLISLKAGGFGLNLTEADYVFLLDPWWNPAAENQAIDRTHRIGQTRNVMVYRLVAADTIEEKVMALKERKAALFDAVVDDEELFGSLVTADDVRELLS